MMKLAFAIMLVTACGTDPAPPQPRKFGATCTTVVDTASTECDSGVCTNSFDMIGHPVCSQKCTDGSTCPAGADGMKCNMKGYCKP